MAATTLNQLDRHVDGYENSETTESIEIGKEKGNDGVDEFVKHIRLKMADLSYENSSFGLGWLNYSNASLTVLIEPPDFV
jgi:hypothetical protein